MLFVAMVTIVHVVAMAVAVTVVVVVVTMVAGDDNGVEEVVCVVDVTTQVVNSHAPC